MSKRNKKRVVPIGPGVGLKLDPESALNHLDGVAAKFEGSRKDHFILGASIAMLREMIQEHKKWAPIVKKVEAAAAKLIAKKPAEAAAAAKPTETATEKPNGKKTPRTRA